MAFYSMTGFAKVEISINNDTVIMEGKSVNNRFKDIRIRLPSKFLSIENELKKMAELKMKRGTIDIFINLKKNSSSQNQINIDEKKVIDFINRCKKISVSSDIKININASDLLRSEFLVEETEESSDQLLQIKNGFSDLIDAINLSRQEEGNKLNKVFNQLINDYESLYFKIIPLKSNFQLQLKDKFQSRLNTLPSGAFEEGRLMQEVLYYLEKLDIDEEIQRIHSHLTKFRKLLASSEEKGRTMEFLLQELHRETNTIGSKSGNIDISNLVIEMKVILEKIKEQAMNVE